MCGRYRRKSDKQRIADAFEVTAGLDELDLGPEDDIAPGSIQPVVSINQDGERQLELMRWGFKLPDRLLFNARSEGIETSKFWKDAFLKGRVIVPADAIFEWKEMPKGQKKPKYEFTLPGQEPFGMAGVWKLWKNPKTDQWERTFAVITGEPNELMAPDSRPHDDVFGAARLCGVSRVCGEAAASSSPHLACGRDACRPWSRNPTSPITSQSFR